MQTEIMQLQKLFRKVNLVKIIYTKDALHVPNGHISGEKTNKTAESFYFKFTRSNTSKENSNDIRNCTRECFNKCKRR